MTIKELREKMHEHGPHPTEDLGIITKDFEYIYNIVYSLLCILIELQPKETKDDH